MDKTKLSCLVLSVSAVWHKLLVTFRLCGSECASPSVRSQLTSVGCPRWLPDLPRRSLIVCNYRSLSIQLALSPPASALWAIPGQMSLTESTRTAASGQMSYNIVSYANIYLTCSQKLPSTPTLVNLVFCLIIETDKLQEAQLSQR